MLALGKHSRVAVSFSFDSFLCCLRCSWYLDLDSLTEFSKSFITCTVCPFNPLLFMWSMMVFLAVIDLHIMLSFKMVLLTLKILSTLACLRLRIYTILRINANSFGSYIFTLLKKKPSKQFTVGLNCLNISAFNLTSIWRKLMYWDKLFSDNEVATRFK